MLVITIETNNAAFNSEAVASRQAAELSRILHRIAYEIEDAPSAERHAKTIRGNAGNSVGQWTLSREKA